MIVHISTIQYNTRRQDKTTYSMFATPPRAFTHTPEDYDYRTPPAMSDAGRMSRRSPLMPITPPSIPPPMRRSEFESDDNEIQMIADYLLDTARYQSSNISFPVRRIDFNDEIAFKMNSNSLQLLPCSNNSECSICFESDIDNASGGALQCKHTFHNECITKWFEVSTNHSCPNCRSAVNVIDFLN